MARNMRGLDGAESPRSAEPTRPRLAEAIEEIIAELDDRELTLCRDRILSTQPATLAQIGERIRVSRERAGQLDNQVRRRLREAFENSALISETTRWVCDSVTHVADVHRLIVVRPEIRTPVPSVGISALKALAAVFGRFEMRGEWVLAPTAENAVRTVAKLLEANASPEGVVPITVASAAMRVSDEEAARWLTHRGYTIRGAHVLTKTSSIEDHAAALLGIAGTPMTLEAIRAQLIPKRTDAAVRNALVADTRFLKSDRTAWALSRWGLPEYVPIRRQIAKLITENGGSLELATLIESIRSRYDVSEASVRTYASAGEFVQRDNVVSFRGTTDSRGKSPQNTGRVFREGDIVRFRLKINNQHVRGSGFSLPSALATLLGVGPNSAKTFQSRLGPQEVTWASVQARSGTIKRFIDELGLQAGDLVFLEFRAGGEFDVKRTPPPGRGVRAALAMTGHSNSDDPALDQDAVVAELAHAVWLDTDAGLDDIRGVLTRRRELDILEMVDSAA